MYQSSSSAKASRRPRSVDRSSVRSIFRRSARVHSVDCKASPGSCGSVATSKARESRTP